MVVAALAIGASGAVAAPTLSVRITAPAPALTGAPCRVAVTLSARVSRGTARLQERSGRRWRTVARKRLLRRTVTLSCPVAREATTRRFRVVVRRGDRVLARSKVLTVRVTPAPPAGGVPPAGPGPAPPGPSPRPPLDPAQFGAEGTGGPPSPETLALLSNPNITFDAAGIADLQAGRVDPRVVAVLGTVAQTHVLTVAGFVTGYPKFTGGGSVSLHYLGRAVDVIAVDGAPVGPGNLAARTVASDLAALGVSYRPDAIGTPFAISGPGYYTDATTQDRLDIGFRQPIGSSWSPP